MLVLYVCDESEHANERTNACHTEMVSVECVYLLLFQAIFVAIVVVLVFFSFGFILVVSAESVFFCLNR